MTKTFCDACGKELGDDARRSVLGGHAEGGLDDACSRCAKAVRQAVADTIEKLRAK